MSETGTEAGEGACRHTQSEACTEAGAVSELACRRTCDAAREVGARGRGKRMASER